MRKIPFLAAINIAKMRQMTMFSWLGKMFLLVWILFAFCKSFYNCRNYASLLGILKLQQKKSPVKSAINFFVSFINFLVLYLFSYSKIQLYSLLVFEIPVFFGDGRN